MNEECGNRIAELQLVEKVYQYEKSALKRWQKISELLRESGLAIQCLAPGENIPARKEEFERHAEDFARLLEVRFVSPRFSKRTLIVKGSNDGFETKYLGPF